MYVKPHRAKRTRHWGMHLMSMRKLYGPTSNEARLKRMPYNKGNPPPPDTFYMIPNPVGKARSQEFIADVVRMRRFDRTER